MEKIALFAFNGELMCFIHVLLNAIDMNEKGYEVKIVIEGSATKLIPELAEGKNPLSSHYKKAKALNLIEGACKACSAKMGVLDSVTAQGIKLLDDMSGHPGMGRFKEAGFEIITF